LVRGDYFQKSFPKSINIQPDSRPGDGSSVEKVETGKKARNRMKRDKKKLKRSGLAPGESLGKSSSGTGPHHDDSENVSNSCFARW
jgi:hypothetical protein